MIDHKTVEGGTIVGKLEIEDRIKALEKKMAELEASHNQHKNDVRQAFSRFGNEAAKTMEELLTEYEEGIKKLLSSSLSHH